uniref:Putative retrotransposon gag protein n=1 Tax=Oryza sativa subsp. japonica TaxID=39947 RepID=Q6UUK9_ORYSJ|nr:putative retrotransposon gag protein [Oryza sativa Japonica Group]
MAGLTGAWLTLIVFTFVVKTGLCMTGFKLPENFKENPEAFFWSVRPLAHSVASLMRMPMLICNSSWRSVAHTPSRASVPTPSGYDYFRSPFFGERSSGSMPTLLLSIPGTKCSTAFLSKFFPMGKTNALRGRISSFQQTRDESIPEAWERLQEYVAACPHLGMDDWLILQNFYNGLTPMSHDHLDAAAGGAFFSKMVQGAVDLIEKMVSNMGWREERLQTRQRGMHTVKETELLAAKLDLLMKRLDDHQKRPQGTLKALDTHATCEVYGNTGHSGNDCPETREEAMYMGNNNNGYHP